MVRIEADKSERWKSNHCLICGRELKRTEPRYTSTAELLHGGRIVKGNCCESCAKQAVILQAAESVKRGEVAAADVAE